MKSRKKNFSQDNRKYIFLKISLYLMSLWILLGALVILNLKKPGFGSENCWAQIVVLIDANLVPCVCLILILAGAIGYGYFADMLKNAKALPKTIQNCESKNSENLVFLATYIIPLICFPLNSKREILVLFFVIIIIGILFIKTDMYYASPSLILLGFNVYETIFSNTPGQTVIIIAKGNLNGGDTVKCLKLSDNIYYARRV